MRLFQSDKSGCEQLVWDAYCVTKEGVGQSEYVCGFLYGLVCHSVGISTIVSNSCEQLTWDAYSVTKMG